MPDRLRHLTSRAVGRLGERFLQIDERIARYRDRRITHPQAHDLVIKAVDCQALMPSQIPSALKEWREPSTQLRNRFAIKFPIGNLTLERISVHLVPGREQPEISMRGAQQIRSTAEGDRASGARGAILLGTGICLLRLLVGLVAGAVIAGIYATVSLFRSTDDSLTWDSFVALLILVLAIAAVTFLPLWMTDYIKEHELLPLEEIEFLERTVPHELTSHLEAFRASLQDDGRTSEEVEATTESWQEFLAGLYDQSEINEQVGACEGCGV